MYENIKRTKNPPDPARVIEGLRDTGYDFNTAICDIVDNSIAANASYIEVSIVQDFDQNVEVYIADNGLGMTDTELEDAMRYGSKTRPSPKSLGKFGLGLKTASTAFCRCLSVISRSNSDNRVNKACWDLDFVENWELLWPDPSTDEISILDSVTNGGSGTIVYWTKVDRLMRQYKNDDKAAKAFDRVVANLKQHIAGVYQRYIDYTDSRAENVKIVINGETIKPWDPFCVNENATRKILSRKIGVTTPDGKKSTFEINAYIIPRKEDFSSPEAAKDARIANKLQGFYIYRENRLIHLGTWMGMYDLEPHLSLLRIDFSFDHMLDDAFNVDIKKSRILLDEAIFDYLKEFVGPARREAENYNRKGEKKKVEDITRSAHDSSNANIASKENEVVLTKVEVVNKEQNKAKIQNSSGTFVIDIPVVQTNNPNELCVVAADSIDGNALWEPCINEQHHAVRINKGHPYYYKVYVPNLSSGVLVQGMDSLLWALAEAELSIVNDSTKEQLEDFRMQVSKLLKRLVADLPDPKIDTVGDGDEG